MLLRFNPVFGASVMTVICCSLGLLERSDRIEDAGEMLWDLTLVLLLAWILTYVCVVRGIKSSGKVTLHPLPFLYST